MRYVHQTKGTCAAEVSFELVDGKVHDVQFVNGCNGNLQAIGRLVEGLTPEEVVERCAGISCKGKGTSCADQLSVALTEAMEQMEGK